MRPGQGFAGLILQIPEPSSLALCGFGGCALYPARRKQIEQVIQNNLGGKNYEKASSASAPRHPHSPVKARGTITFNNSATTLVVYQLNYGSPDTHRSPSAVAMLNCSAPLGTTDLQLFQPVLGLNPLPISVQAGRFTGAPGRFLPDPGSGHRPGCFWFRPILRGWTGTANAWYDGTFWGGGLPPIFTIDTGDPTTTPAGVPALGIASGNNPNRDAAFTGLDS